MKYAFPWSDLRRYTAPGPYIAYRRHMRIAVAFMVPAIALEVLFSPVPQAALAVRIALIACVALFCGIAAVASVIYVLAWDELQRRALAESGAIAALLTIAALATYGYAETLFQAPHLNAVIWAVAAGVLWRIVLPFVRRHYES